MAEPRRRLVTLHLPLEMGMVGRVLAAIGEEYPAAVVAQTGSDSVVWSRRLQPGEQDERPRDADDVGEDEPDDG